MIKGAIYSIKQALRQGFRNKGMTLASVFSITAMMLILALFFFLSVNVSYLTENIKDQFGTIEVFLKDDTTSTQAANMIDSFKDMPGVETAGYISKERPWRSSRPAGETRHTCSTACPRTLCPIP